jgi:DNA-binding NarL/FixJ family response regulator
MGVEKPSPERIREARRRVGYGQVAGRPLSLNRPFMGDALTPTSPPAQPLPGAGFRELAGMAPPIAGSQRPQHNQDIRVAVVSDVRLVREGVTIALRGRDGIAELCAVDLGADGLAAVAQMAPDVILVDLGGALPRAVARQLKAACPTARLVAFALAEIDHEVFACAASGFAGYVAKDGGADDLHRAVLDATYSRMHCAPHIAAAMFERLGALLRPEANTAICAQLTHREIEILSLADQGRSNKDIARLLRISCATVKNHMHSILQKLHVTRRGEAAARLRENRRAI